MHNTMTQIQQLKAAKELAEFWQKRLKTTIQVS
jgi:hypothetical protein